MAIRVEIDGKGKVAEFPDGTDPAVIDAAIQRDHFSDKKPETFDPNAPVDGVPKWGRDNPNTYAATMTALDMAPALASFAKKSGFGMPIAGAVNAGAKAIQRGISGEDTTGGKVLSDFAVGAGVEGVGRGAGKVLSTITDLPLIADLQNKLAKKTYQSAMKFSNSPSVLSPEERAAITETGLKNNFMPQESDYLRLKAMVGDNTGKVDNIINAGAAQGDQIPVNNIVNMGDLAGLMSYGKNVGMVAPEYKAAVSDQVSTLYNKGANVSPVDVNDSKRLLYQQLEDAYKNNTLSDPKTQSKKQIAKGMKLALEDMYPEIGKLNANSKELLDLSDHLARSIGRVQNRDIISLGDKVVMDMVGNIPKADSAANSTFWGAMVAAIDRPIVKAKLARALYKANTGETLPMSQWKKGMQFISNAADSTPVRGAFDAAILTTDPLGLR